MKSLVSAVVTGALVVGLLACGPKATVAFDGYGYKHQAYGYRLLNQSGDKLLPPEWQLDNLRPHPRLRQALQRRA